MSAPFELFAESPTAVECAAVWAAANPGAVMDRYLASDQAGIDYEQWLDDMAYTAAAERQRRQDKGED